MLEISALDSSRYPNARMGRDGTRCGDELKAALGTCSRLNSTCSVLHFNSSPEL